MILYGKNTYIILSIQRHTIQWMKFPAKVDREKKHVISDNMMHKLK